MNESSVEPTIVIFRYWDDEVIALFPTEPSSVTSPYHCESYMHVGQHGGCDLNMIIVESKPATPEQYNALKLELERLGYVLNLKRRYTMDMYQQRLNNWNKIMNYAKN